ncbi:MAG TPA: hypothetical protein VFV11_07815 [Solimonas sp.]|nr:hypothetical protein [Solimonas sp.]
MASSRARLDDVDVLSTLSANPRDRLKTLLARGPRVPIVRGLAGVLEDPRTPLGTLVAKPPRLGAAATRQADGSRARVVLVKVDTTDGGRAGGTTASLYSADGRTLLDTARVDRRGLVLLRFPQGMGDAMGALPATLRLGTAPAPLSLEVPAGQQHLVLHTRIAPEEAVGIAGETVGTAGELVGDATENVDATTATLTDAITALNEAAEALAASTATAGDALDDAATAITAAATEIRNTAAALTEAAAALGAAAASLADDVPTDSVVSRLPISFSPSLGDSVARLLAVAEGPIPGIDTSTQGISTSRMPLYKEFSVLRLVGRDRARRFVVRIRQEWIFVGLTLGELTRVDALDPASVTGTLDATLTASVQAGLTLDAGTASRLQASLAGQLSAQAAIDSALDVAVNAKLDANLKAHAGVGLFTGGFGSAADIFGELVGVKAGASLDAELDVHAHTELSIRSSLLASARINAAASLVNQVRVQISATLDAQAKVNARLVAQINPSLARAVNLLRFVMYDVYAVTSRVEDVVEIVEEKVFSEPPSQSPPMFPPADVVEYRPFFQPRLLEPQLAAHFGLLRRSLSDLRAGGEPIHSLQMLVDYAATGAGADLSVLVGGRRMTIPLRPGSGATTARLNFNPPVRPADLTEALLTLTQRTPSWLPMPVPANGTTRVTRIEIRYDGSAFLDDLGTFNAGELEVGPNRPSTDGRVQLNPRMSDYNPYTDALVQHINRNRHYYLGVLASAAIRRAPSLRQDAPQLAEIGVDSPLWTLPLLGFVGDRALLLREPEAGDPAVKELMADEGTSTIVQLASAGLYTEAAQGRLQISEVVGRAHPALQMAQPPLPTITGLDVLANGGGLGAPNLTGALATLAPLLQQAPGLGNLGALGNLLATVKPPESPTLPSG